MSRSLDGLRDWVRRSARPPAEPRDGILVVAGGKGGVGTSTVAGLLALALARKLGSGGRVLLVEAGPGGLPLRFGVEGEVAGIADLSRGGLRPEELVRPVAPGVEMVPAGGWEVYGGPDGAERALLLRRVMDLYPDYDQVVVDAGARADSVHAATQAGLGTLMVVTQRDRVAAAGAYALVKALGERIPELPVILAVNRASPAEGRSVAGVVQEAAANFLGASLPLGPVVPPDAQVSEASVSGQSLAELAEGPALRALEVYLASDPPRAAGASVARSAVGAPPGNITRPGLG
jgi:MinD-like ATPase involved in chromosome partitioning or flagellar assembly